MMGRAVTSAGSVLWVLMAGASGASAYDSGSTGALGPFMPSAHTVVQLPEDGVLHYTEVVIPSGVTVTFLPNELNTPVYLLASGDVTIAGIVDVSGTAGTTINKKHITRLGGRGGPGGSAGASSRSGTGLNATMEGMGPGAGRRNQSNASGGASHLFPGNTTPSSGPAGRPAHGGLSTYPLHGGSGGSTPSATGSGGGGGGSLTIAASGTLNISGTVRANGGAHSSGSSGGAGNIRLIASEIVGNGTAQAISQSCGGWSPCGGEGFILMEAYDITGAITVNTNPAPFYGEPSITLPFEPGEAPTLRVTSVNGLPAPIGTPGSHPLNNPTLTLQQDTTVNVEIEASRVPVGTPVRVGLSILGSARVEVDAPPLEGSLLMSTTSVELSIPAGARVGVIEAWIASVPEE